MPKDGEKGKGGKPGGNNGGGGGGGGGGGKGVVITNTDGVNEQLLGTTSSKDKLISNHDLNDYSFYIGPDGDDLTMIRLDATGALEADHAISIEKYIFEEEDGIQIVQTQDQLLASAKGQVFVFTDASTSESLYYQDTLGHNLYVDVSTDNVSIILLNENDYQEGNTLLAWENIGSGVGLYVEIDKFGDIHDVDMIVGYADCDCFFQSPGQLIMGFNDTPEVLVKGFGESLRGDIVSGGEGHDTFFYYWQPFLSLADVNIRFVGGVDAPSTSNGLTVSYFDDYFTQSITDFVVKDVEAIQLGDMNSAMDVSELSPLKVGDIRLGTGGDDSFLETDGSNILKGGNGQDTVTIDANGGDVVLMAVHRFWQNEEAGSTDEYIAIKPNGEISLFEGIETITVENFSSYDSSGDVLTGASLNQDGFPTLIDSDGSSQTIAIGGSRLQINDDVSALLYDPDDIWLEGFLYLTADEAGGTVYNYAENIASIKIGEMTGSLNFWFQESGLAHEAVGEEMQILEAMAEDALDIQELLIANDMVDVGQSFTEFQDVFNVTVGDPNGINLGTDIFDMEMVLNDPNVI